MNRLVAILFFAVVAAQVVGLLAFAGVREASLLGREVVLQTMPVDPRSLLQGDYAILGYEIGQVPRWVQQQSPGTVVYVVLEDDGPVWNAVNYITDEPPSSGVYIRGEINHQRQLDFGIGTYFVPEGTGRRIELARDVKVVVSLDRNGRAVIKQVMVDGAPFNPDGG